jgi:4-amino-4-deoxy-L-arabinose transferase-like glycosyltransferase
MSVFGQSISGARWVIVLFAVLGLLSVVWVTWLLAGPVAAAASGVLLAVSPAFLVYGRAVEAEIPMMALLTLSLALVLAYRASGLVFLPLLSGLVLAAAILMKLFAVEAVLPAMWVLLGPQRDRRALAVAATFLVAAIAPVVLEMLLVAPQEQWQQVVQLHNAAAGLSLPGELSGRRILQDFFTLDLGLTVLAFAGLLSLLLLQVWDELIFLALWLGGQLLMLILFRPLFPHHMVILIAAIAVCGGVAVTVWVEQIRSRRWLAAAPIALAALVYLATVPRIAHADRHAVVPGVPARTLSLAAYVDGHTRASDLVATDDLGVADLADRLVPPGLCDPSTVRLRAGYLPASELIGQTSRYHARMVLPSTGTYFQVTKYMRWVRAHYRSAPAPDGVTAYLAR